MAKERRSLGWLLVVLGVLLLPFVLFAGECAKGFQVGWNASKR